MKNFLILFFVLFLCGYSKSNHLLNTPIEMRDGINLYTDIYIPSGNGPFPVILSRVPYITITRNI